MGYHRAGFEVTGVDKLEHPSYPFTFMRKDTRTLTEDFLASFDVIAASPPCPKFSSQNSGYPDRQRYHRDLLGWTRDKLIATGKPYVIENVAGAPLIDPIKLCGSMFGLAVRRHRLFESNLALQVNGKCDHKAQGYAVGVYGHRNGMNSGVRENGQFRGRTAANLREGELAMGIDWMSWSDLKDAIPPAYTEHLGRQILELI